ncbi:uncharacterized protein [Elaeis guineensis]
MSVEHKLPRMHEGERKSPCLSTPPGPCGGLGRHLPAHLGRAVETVGRFLVAGSVSVLATGVRLGGQRRAVVAVVMAGVGGETASNADMSLRLLSASTLSSGCGKSKGLALSANQGQRWAGLREGGVGASGAAEGFPEVHGVSWPGTPFLGLVLEGGLSSRSGGPPWRCPPTGAADPATGGGRDRD